MQLLKTLLLLCLLQKHSALDCRWSQKAKECLQNQIHFSKLGFYNSQWIWHGSYHIFSLLSDSDNAISFESFGSVRTHFISFDEFRENSFFSSRKQFNLAKFYINRYVRFFAIMAVIMLYYMTSISNYGHSIRPLAEPCKKLKWKALLFIQNFSGQPFVSSTSPLFTSGYMLEG